MSYFFNFNASLRVTCAWSTHRHRVVVASRPFPSMGNTRGGLVHVGAGVLSQGPVCKSLGRVLSEINFRYSRCIVTPCKIARGNEQFWGSYCLSLQVRSASTNCALKTGAVCASETLVTTEKTARRYNAGENSHFFPNHLQATFIAGGQNSCQGHR